MPHVLLEHSHKVEAFDYRALFAELHDALAELSAFPKGDIKSRAVHYETSYVGEGDETQAFAHITLSLLAGRDISVRQRLVQACLRVLTGHFAPGVQKSVEVREMDRATYAKDGG